MCGLLATLSLNLAVSFFELRVLMLFCILGERRVVLHRVLVRSILDVSMLGLVGLTSMKNAAGFRPRA